MLCSKCKEDFSEKDIQESHDIPKYMGGTDKDGRHWLCKECHEKYELEVLKVSLMHYIKQLPEEEKKKFRYSASLVKSWWWKNGIQ